MNLTKDVDNFLKADKAMSYAPKEATLVAVWNFSDDTTQIYFIRDVIIGLHNITGKYTTSTKSGWDDGTFPKERCNFYQIPERPQVYLAGDMLNRGAQMQRAAEKEEITDKGFRIYNPQDNKEINDKENAVQEGLAERIVKHDTDAIVESDIVVIEPLQHALGTIAELGQIHGIKLMADKILEIAYSEEHNNSDEALQKILDLCFKQENKLVLPHNSDIRRTDISETGDRRSFGMHQYVYGLCLDLTEGKGMYSWDEITSKLSEHNTVHKPLHPLYFDEAEEQPIHGKTDF